MRGAFIVCGPVLFYRGARNRWPSDPDVIGIQGGRRFRRRFWRVFVRTSLPIGGRTHA